MNDYSWTGHLMMNPNEKIGRVINDNNQGIFRILTVEFDDKTKEELWLANIGINPKASQKWKWLFEHNGKKEWTLWGG